jgi:hypothetical protein
VFYETLRKAEKRMRRTKIVLDCAYATNTSAVKPMCSASFSVVFERVKIILAGPADRLYIHRVDGVTGGETRV